VLKKAPSLTIKKTAIARGMRTLRQDGWHKVINGISTPEEVMKVTSAEEAQSKVKGEESFYKEYSPEPLTSSIDLTQVPGAERRIYSRLAKKVNLRYKVFESKEELAKRGLTHEQLSVTKDISAGGLLFLSDEQIPIDSIVELKVELPGKERPIECLGRVIRVEAVKDGTYNIAACFLDIATADKARLSKYVESEEY
jgi:c-di-GMP-binding flagellar brake protein YcgR